MYELLPLAPLLLASLEDIRYKAVPDSINYFALVFTFFLAIHNFISHQIIPKNILFSLAILIFFFILFSFKMMAIGDVFLMLWLSYYLGFMNVLPLLEFLIFTFLSGFLVSLAYSMYILKQNKQPIKLVFASLVLTTIAIIDLVYLYKIDPLNFQLYLISVLLILFSYVLFKREENKVKELLIFTRTPNELVEGDWVEVPIKVKEIPKNLEDEVKKYFSIEKKSYFELIPKENLLYGSKGLSKKQIEILQALGKECDIKIRVKEGFPMVPAILLGYLLAIL